MKEQDSIELVLKRLIYLLLIVLMGVGAMAQTPQQNGNNQQNKPVPKAQPKGMVIEDETIPDSLLHPRWKIQKTAPVLTADLDSSALDLRMPENVKQQVEYNDSLNVYIIGSKIGDSYLNAPIVMTPEEYMQWSERRARQQFFRNKDAENVKAKGKEMFDLGLPRKSSVLEV